MSFIIREAKQEDAEQLIAHVTAIADDPTNEIALWPGEFKLTIEEERHWIQKNLEADHSTVLVAETRRESSKNQEPHSKNQESVLKFISEIGSSNLVLGTSLIGVVICIGGEHLGNHHTTTLGITVHKDWRNQGVGRALMNQAIAWAKATGVIKRMQLGVTSTNAAAIHLYETMGFEKEGLRRRGLFKNGRFYDTWLMGLLLD